MGLFDSVSGALGSLHPLSEQELEDEREAVRERYVSSADVNTADALYHEMHRYDEEMTRRANEAYDREIPSPPEPRRREHGWYLPNDD